MDGRVKPGGHDELRPPNLARLCWFLRGGEAKKQAHAGVRTLIHSADATRSKSDRIAGSKAKLSA
jgi:hypothetical protein